MDPFARVIVQFPGVVRALPHSSCGVEARSGTMSPYLDLLCPSE